MDEVTFALENLQPTHSVKILGYTQTVPNEAKDTKSKLSIYCRSVLSYVVLLAFAYISFCCSQVHSTARCKETW